MTSQQRITIQHIEATHEAERFIASEAAREVAELDVRSVLVAIQVKMNDGDIDGAKAIAKAWKAGQL